MTERSAAEQIFVGDSEMARRMREHDWPSTAIGPLHTWPQSLRTAVSICLASRFPMLLWWGPSLSVLYNDAYIPIFANKHPWVLGRTGQEAWGEVWDVIGPMFERVMSHGEATWSADQLLELHRRGFVEETYFTWSYSPIRDESGGVGGVFTAVIETTERVLSARRLSTLRELSEQAFRAMAVRDAVTLAAETLAKNPADLPFALVYLRDSETPTFARVAATSSVLPDEVAPARHAPEQPSPWPMEAVAGSHESCTVDLTGPLAVVPSGHWPEPVAQAQVLKLTGAQDQGIGVLIAGLSPRLAFDEAYRAFLELVARHVSQAISTAGAYEDERRRAESLAELDRAKTAFFSNVSHEFRTPLTLILGPLADARSTTDELPPALREPLELAHRNGVRLLKLVNTLLDFSRIEAGRVEARYHPVDLGTLTRDLASAFRSAMDRAGLRFAVECPRSRHPVFVDREMWEKIVSNLLSNAFKYTFEGSVTIALDEDANHVHLRVSDTGTGIPAAEVPKLFERFHRVEGARGRTQEGTGIGLALVQDLVRLHGGSVSVESELGRGSTFTVTLPLGSAHLPADRIGSPGAEVSTALRAAAFADEAMHWLPDQRGVETAGAREPHKSPPVAWQSGQRRPTVLVADDNADMRTYVGSLLAGVCDVVAVADGVEAIQAAREHVPDVVLSDVMMPRLDGFELLRTLRADERTAAIPVILLSARAGEEARVEGLDAGADDYLTKPFGAKELIAKVSSTIALTVAREQSAAALRESERRFRHLADSAPVMVWVTEADGTCTFLSRSWYEFTGQTPETGLGFGWLEATHPDDREQAGALFLAANERREPFRLEYRLRQHDGAYRWAIDAAAPRFGDAGEFLGYVGSVIDITDRKEAERARDHLLETERTARLEAERVNRMKDEFLATLSHELRTPLHAILGWAQILDRDGRDPAEVKKGLAAIGRNARAQTQMIEDLLDMSRIVSGKIRLDVQRLTLASVIEQAVLSALPAANARSLRIEQILDPRAGPMSGDPARLQQVFWNLLTNAVKFTPKGGKIQIVLERVNSHVEVAVRDTGAGIAPDMLPHVFERFRQADATTTRSRGGLGLGLSIVKELVELHGGTVTASSPGVDRGSTFVVTLPLLVAVEAEADEGRRHPTAPPLSADQGARPALSGVTVLVVDDEDDGRALLQRILEDCGARVLSASDVRDALDLFRRERPDLVISDIGMPGQDGYDLIRQIRALSEADGGGTPAVALTAYARSEDRQRVLRAGFQMHIAKPVEQAELWAVCASITGRLDAR